MIFEKYKEDCPRFEGQWDVKEWDVKDQKLTAYSSYVSVDTTLSPDNYSFYLYLLTGRFIILVSCPTE